MIYKTSTFILYILVMLFTIGAYLQSPAHANEHKEDNKKPKTVNTTVSGVIRESDNSRAIGATVIVTCNHNGLLTTHTAISSKEGKYSVIFDPIRCKNGDTLSVTAAGGNDQGSNDGKINGRNGFVNVLLVDSVASVPEFGLITGLLATATSLGGYLLVKRRTS